MKVELNNNFVHVIRLLEIPDEVVCFFVTIADALCDGGCCYIGTSLLDAQIMLPVH